MENDTKLSNEQIENLKNQLQKVSSDQNSEELMKNFLNKEQTETVKKVLANPDKVKEIMNSPLAKSFLERFNQTNKE